MFAACHLRLMSFLFGKLFRRTPVWHFRFPVTIKKLWRPVVGMFFVVTDGAKQHRQCHFCSKHSDAQKGSQMTVKSGTNINLRIRYVQRRK